MNVRTISLVAILAYSLTATTVFAAESSAKKSMYPTVDASQKIYKAGEDELKARLVAGKDKPFYRQKLEKMGYAITAVNSDTNDYLEYEVIKGGHSYEVQVDFKNGVADKVDIANNVWEAKSTKEALKKKDYTYVYPIGVTSNPELVSERTCGEAWREEMIKIEQDLGIGHDRHYYRPALENMGYKGDFGQRFRF
jgi:hypothetical protein